METNIDCLKYRKSTHLAGIDVETMIAEKGKCELTIKLAYYDRGVNVAGKKVDGYFLRFEEPGVKEMMLNSGNRKKIANIVRLSKNLKPVEARNLKNWVGVKIKLNYDPSVKFAGQEVGGIVVDSEFIPPKLKPLSEVKAELDQVNSRESFDKFMINNRDFMENPEIVAKCKELSVKYPKK